MLRTDVHPARDALLAGLPVAERRLEIAGASTAVLEGGDGPPLVLLHGPGANAAHWLRVIPDLVAGHRVIAPDLPGHGASDPSRRPRRLARGADRGDVSGAAGRGRASRRAARSPRGRRSSISELIGRLVLVDVLGLTRVRLRSRSSVPRCMRSWPRRHPRRTTRLWTPVRVRPAPRARGAGRALGAVRGLQPRPGGGAGRHGRRRRADRGLRGRPIEGLERLELPVALVWGRQDPATPLAVAEAARARATAGRCT